jgi:PBSX family phage terminase large subunit
MALMMSEKQKDYYSNSNAKINISHGAVRSGKTWITNLRWLKYIRQGPPGTLLMSGRTKDSIKENVLNDIFDLVGKENYHYKESTGELLIFGRQIKVVGADDIDAEKRIRGRTYAGWYGDEITIQHPSFVRQAISRCSVANAQIFWTTNPDHPKHHIKTGFIDNKTMLKAGMVKVWHFLLTDNLTLTSDYIELVKASFSGVFYQRNILGLWVIAEGMVYPEYSREAHRVGRKKIAGMLLRKAFKEYIAGVDWGSSHPLVGLLIGVTADDEYYVIDEFYKERMQTEDLAHFFLKWEEILGEKIYVLFCDSAEPDRIITLQAMGLKAKGCDKEQAAGINSVQTALRHERLYINEKCENVDNEFQTYRYPDKDEDPTKYKQDKPLDEDDHAMDALRYAIHNYEKYLIGQQRKLEREKRRQEKVRRRKGENAAN